MTQEQLDILCVNTQSMLGMQGWELIKLLSIGDRSSLSYASRHLALHGLMNSIKDMVISDEILTDQEIFDVQGKIYLLLLQDKNAWDNSIPLQFGFS
jgi:hypothetical protein